MVHSCVRGREELAGLRRRLKRSAGEARTGGAAAADEGGVRKGLRGPAYACRPATAAWLFLAPALLALAVAGGWPRRRGPYSVLALTESSSPAGPSSFIGLKNLPLAVWTDPDWWRALSNTLLFASIDLRLALRLARRAAPRCCSIRARGPSGRANGVMFLILLWAILTETLHPGAADCH